MRRMNKKIVFVLTSIIFISLFAAACKKEEVKEELEEGINTSVGTKDNDELVNRAENIADNLVELIGVVDATAIIYENEAIVAVEMGEEVELDKDMLDMIKNITMEGDEKINDVKIIADEKIFDIIDNIAQSLIKGDSIQNYKTEVNKIIKKIK